MIKGCVNVIEGCQRISGGLSRKLLTNIRSHTIGFLYYLMAVLVAISIPIFTSQLEKSREAVDASNIRAAYAEVMTEAMTNDKVGCYKSVGMKQSQQKWQNTQNDFPENLLGPTAAAATDDSFQKNIASDTTIATGTAGQIVYVVYVPATSPTVPSYVKITDTAPSDGTNLGGPTATNNNNNNNNNNNGGGGNNP